MNSGFRPGAITATGNRSYHSMGRAVDIPPEARYFDWIRANYGRSTKELIFSPEGSRQLWNGQPHVYGEPTKSMHYDHVHWAMANGGVINEPVMGRGLLSGGSYSFGERGPETVTPGIVGRDWVHGTMAVSGSTTASTAMTRSALDVTVRAMGGDEALATAVAKKIETRMQDQAAVNNLSGLIQGLSS